jgi:hypothetical protein
MSWFRLDDQGAFHAKVVAAGNEAYGAWCRAGQWSSAHLTEGRIPREIALAIAPLRVWKRLDGARGTSASGLVEFVGGDIQIHDYLDYNPTADEELAKRASRSAAGRAGGQKSAARRQANAQAKGQAKAQAIASPPTCPQAANDRAEISDPGLSASPDEFHDSAPKSLISLNQRQANAQAKPKQNSTPSPSPSPIPEDPPVVPQTRQPAQRRFERGTTGQEARERYTTAIATATRRPFALERDTRHDLVLCDLLNTHAPLATLETALSWLDATVAEWVQEVDPRFTAGYRPAKLLDWVQADKPKRAYATGTDGPRRAEPDRSNDPSRRRITDEDLNL